MIYVNEETVESETNWKGKDDYSLGVIVSKNVNGLRSAMWVGCAM